MSERPTWLSRKLIVYPKLQLFLMVYPLFTFALVITIIHFGVQYLSFVNSYFLVAGVAVIVSVIALLSGLILTNRIFGPLFRLREHMNKVANGGSPDPIQFRANDWLPDIEEKYNKILERLKNKDSSVH